MSGRRAVIGIRTKQLSDEVYAILDAKSSNKELPAYLNQLVKQDIEKKQHAEREDYLISLMQSMQKELEQLRKDVATRSFAPVHYQEPLPLHEETNITEGKIVNEEEVTGIIEEETEFDL